MEQPGLSRSANPSPRMEGMLSPKKGNQQPFGSSPTFKSREKSGWLKKLEKTTFAAQWQLKWLKLQDGNLQVYRDSQEPKPERTLDLRHFMFAERTTDAGPLAPIEAGGRYIFAVKCTDKTIIFQALEEQDLFDWLGVLAKPKEVRQTVLKRRSISFDHGVLLDRADVIVRTSSSAASASASSSPAPALAPTAASAHSASPSPAFASASVTPAPVRASPRSARSANERFAGGLSLQQLPGSDTRFRLSTAESPRDQNRDWPLGSSLQDLRLTSPRSSPPLDPIDGPVITSPRHQQAQASSKAPVQTSLHRPRQRSPRIQALLEAEGRGGSPNVNSPSRLLLRTSSANPLAARSPLPLAGSMGVLAGGSVGDGSGGSGASSHRTPRTPRTAEEEAEIAAEIAERVEAGIRAKIDDEVRKRVDQEVRRITEQIVSARSAPLPPPAAVVSPEKKEHKHKHKHKHKHGEKKEKKEKKKKKHKKEAGLVASPSATAIPGGGSGIGSGSGIGNGVGSDLQGETGSTVRVASWGRKHLVLNRGRNSAGSTSPGRHDLQQVALPAAETAPASSQAPPGEVERQRPEEPTRPVMVASGSGGLGPQPQQPQQPLRSSRRFSLKSVFLGDDIVRVAPTPALASSSSSGTALSRSMSLDMRPHVHDAVQARGTGTPNSGLGGSLQAQQQQQQQPRPGPSGSSARGQPQPLGSSAPARSGALSPSASVSPGHSSLAGSMPAGKQQVRRETGMTRSTSEPIMEEAKIRPASVPSSSPSASPTSVPAPTPAASAAPSLASSSSRSRSGWRLRLRWENLLRF